jgi:hypothetical protein
MIKFKSIIAISTLSLVSSMVPANADAGITYMEAVATGVSLDPFATAGDSVGNYLIGGIPDGMGVIPVNGKLRVLTNHEWSNANPLAASRASAAGLTTGSYVSEMHYDLKKKSIVAGKDFMEWVEFYDYQTGTFGYNPTAPAGAVLVDQYGSIAHSYLINRFCKKII